LGAIFPNASWDVRVRITYIIIYYMNIPRHSYSWFHADVKSSVHDIFLRAVIHD
jgi:hypothetical protein